MGRSNPNCLKYDDQTGVGFYDDPHSAFGGCCYVKRDGAPYRLLIAHNYGEGEALYLDWCCRVMQYGK